MSLQVNINGKIDRLLGAARALVGTRRRCERDMSCTDAGVEATWDKVCEAIADEDVELFHALVEQAEKLLSLNPYTDPWDRYRKPPSEPHKLRHVFIEWIRLLRSGLASLPHPIP